MSSSAAPTVRDNPAQQRYELELPEGIVVADYQRQGDTLIITHTGTPPALRGQGLASKLIAGLLADARERGLKIKPLCSYVVAYFQRHANQRDLLAD